MTYAFWGSLPDMPTVRRYCTTALALLLFCLSLPMWQTEGEALAASAYSPRHSGTEAPGGPKPIEGLPGRGDRSGTTPSGVGYTDAYGNTIDDVQPEEKTRPKRPSPGAYGAYGTKSEYDRPLPDPSRRSAQPAWSYK